VEVEHVVFLSLWLQVKNLLGRNNSSTDTLGLVRIFVWTPTHVLNLTLDDEGVVEGVTLVV